MDLITARQAAKIAHRSKSAFHRDVLAGLVPVADQVPGYNGQRLFEAAAVAHAYNTTIAAPVVATSCAGCADPAAAPHAFDCEAAS